MQTGRESSKRRPCSPPFLSSAQPPIGNTSYTSNQHHSKNNNHFSTPRLSTSTSIFSLCLPQINSTLRPPQNQRQSLKHCFKRPTDLEDGQVVQNHITVGHSAAVFCGPTSEVVHERGTTPRGGQHGGSQMLNAEALEQRAVQCFVHRASNKGRM